MVDTMVEYIQNFPGLEGFQGEKDAIRHSTIGTGENIYKCSLCYKSFSKKRLLKKHIRVHGGVSVTDTDDVKYISTTFSVVNPSTTNDNNENEMFYTCKECDKTFSKRCALKKHILKVHGGVTDTDDVKYISTTLSVVNPSSTDNNINNENELFFSCKHCDKTFSRKRAMRKHILKVHGGVTGTDDVDYISTTYSSVTPSTTNEDEMFFSCKECDKTFSRKRLLKKHIIKVHGGVTDTDDVEYISTTYSVMTTSTTNNNNGNEKRVLKKHNTTCTTAANTVTTTIIINDDGDSEKTYICAEGGERFSKKCYLKRHINEAHDLISAIDDSSITTTSTKTNMENDDTNGGNRKSYACTECGKIFNKKSLLKRHVNESHDCITIIDDFTIAPTISTTTITTDDNNNDGDNKKSYMCKDCDKMFSKKRLLKRHQIESHDKVPSTDGVAVISLRTHDNIDPIDDSTSNSASVTNTITTTTTARTTITTTDNDINKKSYTCSLCDEIFFKRRGLKRHMKSHENDTTTDVNGSINKATTSRATLSSDNNNEILYNCMECNKAFATRWYLLKHQNRVHRKERPFKCEMCSKTFVYKSKLQIHCRTHTGEKPFKCELCSKSFRYKCDLQSHNMRHTGEYKCDVCQKAFGSKSDLESHSRIHTGDKQFKCHVCQKAFFTNCGLRGHYRIHTGDKPFKCNVCEKTFITKWELQGHNRIHTGEYKCDVCQKAFSHKSILQRHYMIHSGEKPYTCDICGRAFSQKSNAKTHMERIHTKEERAHQCPFCEKAYTTIHILQKHIKFHPR